MTEYCFSTTITTTTTTTTITTTIITAATKKKKIKKSNKFSGQFFSDFALLLCSFVLSHPLYLLCFLFFSPYIFKLLSFLSPVFVTTTLLLVSLLPSLPHDKPPSMSGPLENLLPEFNGEGEESKSFEHFEELEVYKIVFGYLTCGGDDPEVVDIGSVRTGSSGGSIASSENYAVGISREFGGAQYCGLSTFDQVKANPDGENVCISRISHRSGSSKRTPANSSLKFDLPRGNPDGKKRKIFPDSHVSDPGVLLGNSVENPDEFSQENSEAKSMDVLSAFQEQAKCEKLTSNAPKSVENSEDRTMAHAESDKVEGENHNDPSTLESTICSINGENQSPEAVRLAKSHSRKHGQALEHSHDGSQSQPTNRNLGCLRPGRREREWRRTLACKLFEERHIYGCGDGGDDGGWEGMDMLWEAYEKTEEEKGKQNNGTMKKKEKVIDLLENEEKEEGEDEDDDGSGQVCCLQALKVSAGKMSFGMGKPGLLKIPKAFKGLGFRWLLNHRRNPYHRGVGGSGKKG